MPLYDFTEALQIKQIFDKPTRKLNTLDLIFTNSHKLVQNHKVFDASLADHCVTECTLSLKKPRLPYTIISYRHFNNINFHQFQISLNNLFHNSSSNTDTVVANMIKCFDSHCPLRVKRIKYKKKKVIASKTTKALIKQNKMVYKLHTRQPSSCTTARLHVLKRQIKAAIHSDTKTHFKEVVQKKGFWKGFIQSFSPKPKPQLNNYLSPDQINDFYIGITTKTQNLISLPNLPATVQPTPFIFTPLTQSIVKYSWSSMNNPLSKSPDPLGISAFMVNLCMNNDNFVTTLTNLFNIFIESGVIPPVLKTSRIVPVPKVDNPTSPNQTRPIGIQPIFTKLFEKCLLLQLSQFIDSNKILSSSQFGFRKNLSTTHMYNFIA